MESGDIKNTQPTVRLPQVDLEPAMQARLFMQDSYFYAPDFFDRHDFSLIVYLREIHMFSGIVLQGAGRGGSWVTEMRVSVSLGPLAADWVFVKDANGGNMVS